MCTLVILSRPGHRWPLLLAANRDEMAERPWLPPGRHWPERPEVVGGLDVLAGGTWLAINDHGVVATVLNRINSLGPAPGLRSRGELPLKALDHTAAEAAAEALAGLDAAAYRPFNLLIADRRQAFWIRARGADDGGAGGGAATIEVAPLAEGLSMITAYDRNDPASPRIRRYLPRFRAAAVPDPESGEWSQWQALLAERSAEPGAGPGGAMRVVTDTGFGTVCASLLALPAAPDAGGGHAVWLFAAGPPGDVPYRPVAL